MANCYGKFTNSQPYIHVPTTFNTESNIHARYLHVTTSRYIQRDGDGKGGEGEEGRREKEGMLRDDNKKVQMAQLHLQVNNVRVHIPLHILPVSR